MHDPHAVRVRERLGDVSAERGAVGRRDALLTYETRAKRFPGDQRHDVEQAATDFAGVEQRHDAGMHQLRHQSDLALEAFRAQGVGQVGGQDFDGDVAPQMPVVRSIHDGHAAAPDLAIELESVRQDDFGCALHSRSEALDRRGSQEIPQHAAFQSRQGIG